MLNKAAGLLTYLSSTHKWIALAPDLTCRSVMSIEGLRDSCHSSISADQALAERIVDRG